MSFWKQNVHNIVKWIWFWWKHESFFTNLSAERKKKLLHNHQFTFEIVEEVWNKFAIEEEKAAAESENIFSQIQWLEAWEKIWRSYWWSPKLWRCNGRIEESQIIYLWQYSFEILNRFNNLCREFCSKVSLWLNIKQLYILYLYFSLGSEK